MKKLTSNKIIAGLLVLMMILSLLPVAAFADGEPSNVHVLESSAMEAFAGGTKTEPEVFGEYFTVYWGTKGKVEALDSAKTWEDYSSAQRLSFDGDTKFANFAEDGVSRVIGFTTEGAATVKVWWVGGGSDGRYLAISDANGNIITQTDPAAKGEILCSELSLEAAGTYYLGNSKTCYFFKVEVTEEAASGGDVEVPEAPAAELVDVTELKEGTPYYIESAMSDGSLYFDGTVNKGRINGTNDATAAQAVMLESAGAEGEYYIVFEVEGVKTYVAAPGSKTSAFDLLTAADESCVWLIDAAEKTIISKKMETRGIATQLASTHTNFSTYATSNFADAAYDVAWLMEYVVSEPEIPTEPETPVEPELVLGTNAIEVADGVNGTALPFTPDVSGTFTLAAAEGEVNVTVIRDYMWKTETVELPYEFNMNAGETIHFIFKTVDAQPDTVDIELTVVPEGTEEPNPENPPVDDSALIALLDGKYNVNFLMNGLYELTFTPDAAGAATGTLAVVDNNANQYTGEYKYAVANGAISVTNADGSASGILLNTNIVGELTYADGDLKVPQVLVKVEDQGGEGGEVGQGNTLILGDNSFNITDSWSGLNVTFTATEGGTYILQPAEGETNADVIYNYTNLTMPYEFTLAAGETISFQILTLDWETDIIDLNLSKKEGGETPDQPTAEDLTLVLGENNVTLVPGVQYNVILTGSEEFYATYILSWLSDKVTITKNDDPLASGATIDFYNANYTVITLTVSEEVNVTLTLAVPAPEAGNELVIGDNALNVPAGWEGMDVTFTAPAAGEYTLSPAEGESNHYVMLIANNSAEGIDLPYTFTLAEGETITFNISAYDYSADEINLVLAAKEGGETEEPDNSIQGALDAELDAEVTVEGEIIYIDGKSIYIKDAAGAAIVVRLNNYADDWKVGDYLKATGKRAEFRGLPQISNPTCEHTPAEAPTMEPISGGAELVKIENLCQTLVISGTLEVIEVFDNDGQYEFPNVTVKDANGNEIVIYKCPNKDIKVGDTVTSITGVLSIYNSNLQILAANASDIVVGSGELNPPLGDSSYMVILAGMTSMVALAAVVVLRKKEIL